MAVTTLTREGLISLCERGVVNVEAWRNRDSEGAQRQLGEAWALLRAGCEFDFDEEMIDNSGGKIVWVIIHRPGFATVDWGGPWEDTHYYLPSNERLHAVGGKDWYC